MWKKIIKEENATPRWNMLHDGRKCYQSRKCSIKLENAIKEENAISKKEMSKMSSR